MSSDGTLIDSATPCQSLSDLERATEHHLIKLAAGKLRSSRHTMERLIAQIRDGLLEDGDGAFERFLVHRFMVSYLEVIIRQKRVMTAVTAAEKHNLAQLFEQANRRQVKCAQTLMGCRRSRQTDDFQLFGDE